MSYTKVFMRVKLKELANEVRIIKAEERRAYQRSNQSSREKRRGDVHYAHTRFRTNMQATEVGHQDATELYEAKGDPELHRQLVIHRTRGSRGSLQAELRATQLFLCFLRGTPRSRAERSMARLPRPVYERLRKMQRTYEPARTEELTQWLRV